MPSPVRCAIVRQLLQRKGYTLVRVTGSHHVFVMAKVKNQVVPVHNGQVAHVCYKQAVLAP